MEIEWVWNTELIEVYCQSCIKSRFRFSAPNVLQIASIKTWLKIKAERSYLNNQLSFHKWMLTWFRQRWFKFHGDDHWTKWLISIKSLNAYYHNFIEATCMNGNSIIETTKSCSLMLKFGNYRNTDFLYLDFNRCFITEKVSECIHIKVGQY